MTKKYVAWATITETIKFYFTAQDDESAIALLHMVNAGELDLEDLHKGNYSTKGYDIVCDEPEEAR